jgi:hypothetical protein
MQLLTTNTCYYNTIELAKNLLSHDYNKGIIFHCYWNGDLNEKHYYSILSFYYFNIFLDTTKKHKIILWVENNTPNNFNTKISAFAEIRLFSLENETNDMFFKSICDNLQLKDHYKNNLSFYSDYVRYVLLYKYAGCWFDLDCLCLRSFDTLFYHYENSICVYQWEKKDYPNGAIYISLTPHCEKFKKNIEYIMANNINFAFAGSDLKFNTPLELLVLPCSWFDAGWIENPISPNLCDVFFEDNQTKYDFETFLKGAFCFHWHNRWSKPVANSSILQQLVDIMMDHMNLADIKQ